MKLSRATIALYIGLVFASGAVLGVFGNRLYMATTVNARPSPEDVRKRIVAEYKSRMDLSDDQVAQLNMIMDETRARIEETRQKLHPAYQKIREEQQAKLRDLLSPQQQAVYDQILKERQARQRPGGGRGGPGL